LPFHGSKAEVIEAVKEWRYSFDKKPFISFLKSILIDCRRTFTSLRKHSHFNIINFHQPFTAAAVLSSSASRGIPTVYTCHSLSFEEYASQSSPPSNVKEWLSYRIQLLGRRLVEKAVLTRSDQIVALSSYTREKLEKVYNFPRTKISLIPGGVDLGRFTPPENKLATRRNCGFPEDRFILLTIRNLEPRMGLENLILAMKKVVGEKPDTLLILGGAGPLSQKLRDLARDLGVAESIKFTGYIPEEELPAYYQMTDLFILPTKELEGFGLVTVEALASGLPVLGTPVGGTKEILAHLGPEFLFADSTPSSMARLILKAMQTWATNPESYNQISMKCRNIAEKNYSWDEHINRLENLFHHITGL
jgi:glycosyltransferase involved in cell wall biosynthesis